MTAEPPSSLGGGIGTRTLRREDARLLTGRGSFIDDSSAHGALEAAFVRSTEAHALLRRIDVSGAMEVPGVEVVLTARDLAGVVLPMRARSGTPGYQECDMPALAGEKVRMVGEPIAVVLARSRYAAEDGVNAVVVDYEPLPAVTTIEQSLAAEHPAIHEEIGDNHFNRFELSSGDVEGAFADPDHLIELEIRQQRYGSAAMENRGVSADYDPARGELTVRLTTQVPHIARTGLAKFLDLPETRVRVISADMGGGFGSKCVLHQDELAIAAAARFLGGRCTGSATARRTC